MAAHPMQHLIIRADASAQMGTGHVMRCLAFAQAWREAGGQVTLAVSTLPPALGERLSAEGVAVAIVTAEPGSPGDARWTANLTRTFGAAWIVVDGYQFGADYQLALKDAGLRVLFIDDYGHAGVYCADLVLNQNCYAHEGLYSERSPHTRLLLGPSYVLLRREFWPWRNWQRETPTLARKLLITMGGADPDNVTLKVLDALRSLEVSGLEIVVILGGGNPHSMEIAAAIPNIPHKIRIERNIDDMPARMAWAELAITAGGSTCYELAFMGVPMLFVVLAENQQPSTTALAEAGVGWNLGWHTLVTTQELADALAQLLADTITRGTMSGRGQSLIDSYGSVRVVGEIRGASLHLRRAVNEDCRLLWEWANESSVRSASFSSEPVSWEQHVDWFTLRVENPTYPIFIGLDAGGIPVGQVRFELNGDVAVISVNIDRRSRGMGYGSSLIGLGSAALFDTALVARIDAYVKPENQRSLRAFERAGFTHIDPVIIRGNHALRLVLYREESRYE